MVKARERPPVLIRWIARPDACIECKRIAAGSPYERLPTWPGLGDTKCVCRCSVEGTRAGNVMAVAGTEPSPEVAVALPVATQAVASIEDPQLAEPAAGAPVTAPPFLFPSLPAIPALRIRPLERRWALGLGALIFIAAFVAIFSTQH
jgi:hypothetical protein